MSTRLPQRQQNSRIQTLLEKWTEPFSTFTYLLGEEYPEKYLENGRLRLLDYILDNFERSWTVEYLSPFPDEPERKHLVRLVRA